jgi:hypothetical protein
MNKVDFDETKVCDLLVILLFFSNKKLKSLQFEWPINQKVW